MGSVALNMMWTSNLFTEHLKLQVSLNNINSKIYKHRERKFIFWEKAFAQFILYLQNKQDQCQ